MKYFYGPVLSRRLGFSLGVDLTPKKTCTFNCVYCQLGWPARPQIRRGFYIDFSQFKKEFKNILSKKPRIDYITLSGSGEPTLHQDLDKIIKIIKKISQYKYPVAVITNSSLLYRKKVRDELKEADLIVPSLDAASSHQFKKINCPHPKIRFIKIKEGCIKLRKEFKGKIWLEIMLLKGLNDSLLDAKKFKKIINKIKPDKVQLNLPIRPAVKKVSIPNLSRIKKIKEIINSGIEIITEFPKQKKSKKIKINQEKIINYLKRRPATKENLSIFFGINVSELLKYSTDLIAQDKIKIKKIKNNKYFVIND